MRRWKWVILATVVAAEGIVLVGLGTLSRNYSATTTLVVSSQDASSATLGSGNVLYLDRLANTYARLASSPPVLAGVQRRLHLAHAPVVAVKVDPETDLVEITARAPSSDVSARIANAVAATVIANLQGIEKAQIAALDKDLQAKVVTARDALTAEMGQRNRLEALSSRTPDEQQKLLSIKEEIHVSKVALNALLVQYAADRAARSAGGAGVSILVPATPPGSAGGPSVAAALVLAILVGGLGGVAIAFVLENLHPTMRGSEAIAEASGAPLVGLIRTEKNGATPLFTNGAGAVQDFRRLAFSVMVTHKDSVPALLIVSTERGEGKSTVTANLGRALALGGRRVLIVDADLHGSTQHRIFDVPAEPGLSDVLTGTDITAAIHETATESLSLLPAGSPPPDPGRLLVSSQVESVMTSLKEEFDVILIDSPAALAVADALFLAPVVDHLLLVVREGWARPDSVERVRDQFSHAGVESVSVIINRADLRHTHYDYGPSQSGWPSSMIENKVDMPAKWTAGNRRTP